jgi:uncharacterized small protein (DUF1192 family)
MYARRVKMLKKENIEPVELKHWTEEANTKEVLRNLADRVALLEGEIQRLERRISDIKTGDELWDNS